MPDRHGVKAARTPFIPRRFWAWIMVAAVIMVVDQATKMYFNTSLHYAQRIGVLPFFDFTLLYNPGAAFSFLATEQGWQRWLFTLIAVGAIGLILHLLRRHPRQILFCVSLSLILGGAVGNLIDRIQYGYVVDFLLFYWRDWHFPAFNVADTAITVGAILLILDEILRIRRERQRKANLAP